MWQKAPSGLEKAFANQPIAFADLRVGAVVSRTAALAAQAAENAREGSFSSQGAENPRGTRGVGRGGISCSGTGFLGAPRKVTGERSGVFKSEFCVLVIGQAYQVHSKHVSRNVKPPNYHHE